MLLFADVGILLYAMIRGLLHMNNGNDWWYGVFSLGTLALRWSPVPTKLIGLAYKIYKTPWFTIARNLVGGSLILKVIWNLAAADAGSNQTASAVLIAVLREAIGL